MCRGTLLIWSKKLGKKRFMLEVDRLDFQCCFWSSPVQNTAEQIKTVQNERWINQSRLLFLFLCKQQVQTVPVQNEGSSRLYAQQQRVSRPMHTAMTRSLKTQKKGGRIQFDWFDWSILEPFFVPNPDGKSVPLFRHWECHGSNRTMHNDGIGIILE